MCTSWQNFTVIKDRSVTKDGWDEIRAQNQLIVKNAKNPLGTFRVKNPKNSQYILLKETTQNIWFSDLLMITSGPHYLCRNSRCPAHSWGRQNMLLDHFFLCSGKYLHTHTQPSTDPLRSALPYHTELPVDWNQWFGASWWEKKISNKIQTTSGIADKSPPSKKKKEKKITIPARFTYVVLCRLWSHAVTLMHGFCGWTENSDRNNFRLGM